MRCISHEVLLFAFTQDGVAVVPENTQNCCAILKYVFCIGGYGDYAVRMPCGLSV